MNLKSDLDDLRATAQPEYTSPTLGQGRITASRSKRFGLNPPLALWLGLRLALVAIMVCFLADEMIWLATLLAIHLVGSWPERAGLGLLLGLSLAAGLALIGDFSSRWRYAAALTLAFGLYFLLFQLIPSASPMLFSLFLAVVLAFNLFPARCWTGLWSRPWAGWAADLLFTWVGIGWAELLLLRPFGGWWLARWGDSKVDVGQDAILSGAEKDKLATRSPWRDKLLTCPTWLPGVVLVASLGALLPSAYSLASLHRNLFPDPAVQRFAQGNFNGLELDLERRVLYTGGYGANYLLAYDLKVPETPPLQSPVENGYAQGFGYNPAEQEVYVYHQERQQLLILDAVRLELKRVIDLPQVSPGDAWVVWDKFSDQIIVASEADEAEGVPFTVIDRLSGEVTGTLDIAPGFILPHPEKPWFYMTISFFQDRHDLVIYDTMRHQIILRTPTPEHLDRLAFAGYGDELELLAPAALGAKILRFDPETLEQKGTIGSLFGARAIAVDPVRRLVLSGSLVTNRLEVIDLDSQQQLAVYYVGPWLRSLSLDVEAGQAYLSSHEGLFRIRYADSLDVEQGE
jgi:hypothetical protein